MNCVFLIMEEENDLIIQMEMVFLSNLLWWWQSYRRTLARAKGLQELFLTSLALFEISQLLQLLRGKSYDIRRYFTVD